MGCARSRNRTDKVFRLRDFKSLAFTSFAIRAKKEGAASIRRSAFESSDGGLGRNRTGVRGFAVRCMTTLPPGHRLRSARVTAKRLKNKTSEVRGFVELLGAGNETRTRDPDLGKVVLYQLSYSRVVVQLF